MLCEKSYIDGTLTSFDTDCRYCELTEGMCLYETPNKSICPIYDKWLRKRTGDKKMINNDRLNEMIEGMKIYADMPYGISINEFSSKDLYEALEELKQRRECELRPATKFVKSTFQEQLNHVKSEIKEIEEAENNPIGTYDYYALLDEITDAQHSLQTLKIIAGATQEDDLGSHRRVTGKNMKRGYYDE